MYSHAMKSLDCKLIILCTIHSVQVHIKHISDSKYNGRYIAFIVYTYQ